MAWSLTREQVVTLALVKMGLLRPGRPAPSYLAEPCLDALDSLLARFPWMGLQSLTKPREEFVILRPGSGAVPTPSDYYDGMRITLFDGARFAGFDDGDSASSAGTEADSGEAVTLIGANPVFGRQAGAIKLVSGSGAWTFEPATADDTVEIELSVLPTTGKAGMVFRMADQDNYWFFGYESGAYKLAVVSGGVEIEAHTYPSTSAGVLSVQSSGQWVTAWLKADGGYGQPILKSKNSSFKTVKRVGVYLSDTAARVKYIYCFGSHAGMVNVPVLVNARFSAERTLGTGAPSMASVSSDKSVILLSPVPDKPYLAALYYTAKMPDSAVGEPPVPNPQWHMALADGIAVEIGSGLGASPNKLRECKERWALAVSSGSSQDVPDGDPKITYED